MKKPIISVYTSTSQIKNKRIYLNIEAVKRLGGDPNAEKVQLQVVKFKEENEMGFILSPFTGDPQDGVVLNRRERKNRITPYYSCNNVLLAEFIANSFSSQLNLLSDRYKIRISLDKPKKVFDNTICRGSLEIEKDNNLTIADQFNSLIKELDNLSTDIYHSKIETTDFKFFPTVKQLMDIHKSEINNNAAASIESTINTNQKTRLINFSAFPPAKQHIQI